MKHGLAGSVLDAMSHQATFLGRYREAANLARAGLGDAVSGPSFLTRSRTLVTPGRPK